MMACLLNIAWSTGEKSSNESSKDFVVQTQARWLFWGEIL